MSASTTPDTFRDTTSHVAEPRRLTTEAKASTTTTELLAHLAAVVAVVVTAIVVDGNGTGASGDGVGASEALRYIIYLTIGYMIARGLAKAGSLDA